MLTVLVVVTHFGLLVGARHVRGRRFNNGLVGLVLELLRSTVGLDLTTFNGVVDLDAVGLVVVVLLRKTRRGVYGSSVLLLVVLRAEALAVLTFSNVNGA